MEGNYFTRRDAQREERKRESCPRRCWSSLKIELDWWCVSVCGRGNRVSKYLYKAAYESSPPRGFWIYIRPMDRRYFFLVLFIFIVLCVYLAINVETPEEYYYKDEDHILVTSSLGRDNGSAKRYHSIPGNPRVVGEMLPSDEEQRNHRVLIVGTPGTGVDIFRRWAENQPSLPYDRLIVEAIESPEVLCAREALYWFNEMSDNRTFGAKLVIVAREPVTRLAHQWHRHTGGSVKHALRAIDVSMRNIKRCDDADREKASKHALDDHDLLHCYMKRLCSHPMRDDEKENLLLPLGMYDCVIQVWHEQGWPLESIGVFPVEQAASDPGLLEERLLEFIGAKRLFAGGSSFSSSSDGDDTGKVSSAWIPRGTRTKLQRYYAYHNARLFYVLNRGEASPLYGDMGESLF